MKENGIHINYYIRKDILDKDCDEVGLTVTLAIERILDDHLESFLIAKPKKIIYINPKNVWEKPNALLKEYEIETLMRLFL